MKIHQITTEQKLFNYLLSDIKPSSPIISFVEDEIDNISEKTMQDMLTWNNKDFENWINRVISEWTPEDRQTWINATNWKKE